MKLSHEDVVDAICLRLQSTINQTIAYERNIQLKGGHCLPDVLAVQKAHLTFSIYECKASKADFMSDLTSAKYLKYLPYSNYLYFAAPANIIDKALIPKEAGLLLIYEDHSTRLLKKAVYRPMEPVHTIEALKSLVFRERHAGLTARLYRTLKHIRDSGASLAISEKIASRETRLERQEVHLKSQQQDIKQKGNNIAAIYDGFSKIATLLGLPWNYESDLEGFKLAVDTFLASFPNTDFAKTNQKLAEVIAICNQLQGDLKCFRRR